MTGRTSRKMPGRMTRMTGKVVLTAAVLLAATFATDKPRGTVPRASADKYAAHTEQNGAALGATMLNAKAMKKAFSADLDNCCIAVEVAIYPQKDGMLEISTADFALRVVGQDIATRSSSPELIAGKLHHNAVADSRGTDISVTPVTSIGYENGIDPYTGQRRSGVTTSTGVGVGIGKREPQPASTEADRRTMEIELTEKSLPEGNTMQPVSGYLYFAVPEKKNTKYQLEYTLNGTKVVLPITPGS